MIKDLLGVMMEKLQRVVHEGRIDENSKPEQLQIGE